MPLISAYPHEYKTRAEKMGDVGGQSVEKWQQQRAFLRQQSRDSVASMFSKHSVYAREESCFHQSDNTSDSGSEAASEAQEGRRDSALYTPPEPKTIVERLALQQARRMSAVSAGDRSGVASSDGEHGDNTLDEGREIADIERAKEREAELVTYGQWGLLGSTVRAAAKFISKAKEGKPETPPQAPEPEDKVKQLMAGQGRGMHAGVSLASVSHEDEFKFEAGNGKAGHPYYYPYFLQGDRDWDVKVHVSARHRLRADPRVMLWLEVFWQTFCTREWYAQLGEWVTKLDKKAFLALMTRVAKALNTDYEHDRALRWSRLDWMRDSRGIHMHTETQK
jgi:hypothetical protein